jgi:hypothetical protein
MQISRKISKEKVTRVESGLLLLQLKASMTMREKLCQIRSALCMNCREFFLEAMAVADNSYSLFAIFGQRHLAINGGLVHFTRCTPMEVIPLSHKNCIE